MKRLILYLLRELLLLLHDHFWNHFKHLLQTSMMVVSQSFIVDINLIFVGDIDSAPSTPVAYGSPMLARSFSEDSSPSTPVRPFKQNSLGQLDLDQVWLLRTVLCSNFVTELKCF